MSAPDPGRDEDLLEDLKRQQSNVVTRKQLLALGWTSQQIRTARSNRWQTIHPGVYLTHTGQPSWQERAWAAVLAAAPAALCLRSGLPPTLDRNRESVIHVAVQSGHRVRGLGGVRVHEMLAFTDRVVPGSPPRIRVEECVLDLVRQEADAWGEVARLCEAVQSRVTTATRLLACIEGRARVRDRTFLTGVLGDIAHGTHSALEYAFLDLVERAHDLPPAIRQAPGSNGSAHRDLLYPFASLAIELDGRGFHTALHDWQRDLSRDLLALVEDDVQTVRLSWRQVVGSPCHTAAQVVTLLQARGWAGKLRACPRCPT